ncbi:MAG TPA: hypothetical protein VJC10_02955 [Patescibacteria group bacterium]|nr:hypothetical protein [Patescibacteria group bacterium]
MEEAPTQEQPIPRSPQSAVHQWSNPRGLIVFIIVLVTLSSGAVLGISGVADEFLASNTDQKISSNQERISSDMIVYGSWAKDTTEIISYDLSSGSEFVLAELPKESKKVTVLSSSSLLFINKVDELTDAGSELARYSLLDNTIRPEIQASAGMEIDDYVLSPNGVYVAVWETAPKVGTTVLLGGRSRVRTFNTQTKESFELYNETFSLQNPVHYPSAVTDDGSVFLDSFTPNTGAGWAYGVTTANIDGSQKEALPSMLEGTYGTKLFPSPRGTFVAFAGYDQSKGSGMQLVNGFRRALVFTNTIEMLNTQTKERIRIVEPDAGVLYGKIEWDQEGNNLLYATLSKDATKQGEFIYNIATKQIKRIDDNTNEFIVSTLSDGQILTGVRDTTPTATGNLGATYSSPFSSFSVINQATQKTIPIDTKTRRMQFIALKPAGYFGIASAFENVIEDSSTKDNLQLELLPITPKPPTEDRHNNPPPEDPVVEPTPTIAPEVPVPTDTPQPTQGIPRQPAGEPRPTDKPDPTPTPPTEPKINCHQLATVQCESLGYDRQVNLDEYGRCVEYWQDTYKQSGQCNSSPLWLYGPSGTTISVAIQTPVFDTDPVQNGKFVATFEKGGMLQVQNQRVNSISFNYSPALRRFAAPEKGVVTSKNNLAHTLASFAKQLGLTKEETDELVLSSTKKITSPYVFVSFFDESFSKALLPISFTPQPDTYINIVFYFRQLWSTSSTNSLAPQFPEVPRRKGITAVEISTVIE